MSITAEDVITRHFPGLTPSEVDAELSRTPGVGAAPISSTARNYLIEHGGEDAQIALEQYDEASVQRDRAIANARALEELLESSLSLEDTAAKMGISRSRVSHRISSGSLYAFTVQGRRYVPKWQLVAASADDLEPIPGLARIVPAIPADLHPLAIQAFMQEPNDDLGGASPLDHVLAHGPVEPIIDLLTALGHW